MTSRHTRSRKYREDKRARVKQGIRAEWHLASEHVESSLSSAAAAATVEPSESTTSTPLLPLGRAATNNKAHTCMVPQDARKSRSRRKSTMRMNEAQVQDAYATNKVAQVVCTSCVYLAPRMCVEFVVLLTSLDTAPSSMCKEAAPSKQPSFMRSA